MDTKKTEESTKNYCVFIWVVNKHLNDISTPLDTLDITQHTI